MAADGASNRDIGAAIGMHYNPWTGQATRDWIMERVSGGSGDGFEEFGD